MNLNWWIVQLASVDEIDGAAGLVVAVVRICKIGFSTELPFRLLVEWLQSGKLSLQEPEKDLMTKVKKQY